MTFDGDAAKRAELVLLAAGALSVLIVFAKAINERFRRSEQVANSFLGGMTASYVFLLLIPEVDEITRVLGRAAPILTLGGFIVFYGMEYATRGVRTPDPRAAPMFWVRTAFVWIYTFLFVLTIPDDLHVAVTFFVLSSAAVAFKLSHLADDLSLRDPRLYSRYGRWVLASAPLAAGIVDVALPPVPEVVVDALTGVVVGFVLVIAFRDTLPRHQDNDFRFFALGIVLYVAIFLSRPLHVG